MDYQTELNQIIEKIELLKYSLERTQLLNDALKLSESNQDEGTQFLLRMDLMSSTSNSGQFHIAFAHLAWCLDKCDKHPESYSVANVLHMYENICQALGDYSSITYEQGLKQLNDFGDRNEKSGGDRRSFLKLLIHYQIDCGKDEDAYKAFLQLLDFITDEFDYESTWELHSVVQYHIHFQELDQAEQKAALLYKTHLNGMNVPDYLFLSLIEISFYKKKYDYLPKLLIKHYDFIDINARTLRVQSKYIYFQCLLGNTAKALEGFQKAQKFYFDLIAEWYQFYFFCYNRCFFQLLKKNGIEDVELTVLPKWEFFNSGNIYEVNTLLQFFDKMVNEKARVLDVKNSNSKYMDYQQLIWTQVDNNSIYKGE
jgi:hypothetical protein